VSSVADSRADRASARNEKLCFLLALLLSLGAVAPLVLGDGFLNTRAGGDSLFLVQRVYELTENLRSGSLPARIMPFAAMGLGYPAYNFYGALPYYVAATLNLLGLGVIGGIQVTQTLAFVMAGVGTYRLIRALGGSPEASLLGAAAYSYAPYHLVNAYTRGDALSELFAMGLYPLVLLATQQCISRPRSASAVALAASFAALVLSHNISAMLFSPIIAAWLLLGALVAKPGWRKILLCGCAGIGLGLALSAWYWAPALRETALVQLGDQTTGYFHYPGHFRGTDLVQLSACHNYRIGDGHDPFSMGLVQTAVAGLGILACLRRLAARSKLRWSTWVALAMAALYTWLITPSSRWVWDHLPYLSYAQFPWRLFAVQAMMIALIASTFLAELPRRAARVVLAVLIACLVAGGTFRLELDRLPLNGVDINRERLMLYEAFSGNIGGTVRHEYLPREMVPRPYTSAVRWAKEPKPEPLVLDGEIESAELLSVAPTSERWQVVVKEKTLLAFHTTFYPGWEATVDGLPQGVEPLPGLGLIGLRLDAGAHDIRLAFGNTPVRRYSGWMSLAAALGCALWIARRWCRRREWRVPVALLAAGVALIAWAQLVPTEHVGSTAIAGPKVMDFVRAPYLHSEPGGIWFGDSHLADFRWLSREVLPGQALECEMIWADVPSDALLRLDLVSVDAHLFRPAPIWSSVDLLLGPGALRAALPIPSDLPPGEYVLCPSVYEGGKMVGMRAANGRSMGTLAFAPLRASALRPSRGNETILGAFGPEMRPAVISLIAADARRNDEGVDIQLEWRSDAQAPLNYYLSVRLRTAQGAELVSRDIPPLLGMYPTSLWRPGELVHDLVLLTAPDDTEIPDRVQLEIVLYDRLTLKGAGTASVVVDVEEGPLY